MFRCTQRGLQWHSRAQQQQCPASNTLSHPHGHNCVEYGSHPHLAQPHEAERPPAQRTPRPRRAFWRTPAKSHAKVNSPRKCCDSPTASYL